MTPPPRFITDFLDDFGDSSKPNHINAANIVYTQLRRMASAQFRHERRGHTLQPTALANEAFVRLMEKHKGQWKSRAEFFSAATRVMRRVLVDHARAKCAQKRGGGVTMVPIENDELVAPERQRILIALDDALVRLAEIDERSAHIVELRFFGGLSIEETAEIVGISPSTVKSDWRVAKARIQEEMEPSR